MWKYERVQKPREKGPDDEVRMTQRTSLGVYLGYLNTLVNDKKLPLFHLRATGNVVDKAVALALLARKRFKGLHMQTEMATQEVEDIYEPLEEGLDQVIILRKLPSIIISLSNSAIDPTHKGYQEPIPIEEVEEYNASSTGRARREGGSRPYRPRGYEDSESEGFRGERGGRRSWGRGFRRGGWRFRGGGRFRGGRGRYRGGGDGYRGRGGDGGYDNRYSGPQEYSRGGGASWRGARRAGTYIIYNIYIYIYIYRKRE